MNKILCFTGILVSISWNCLAQKKQLDIGEMVPAFSLQNQDGRTFNIHDSLGKKLIVIFFYSKDEGFLCKKEICRYNDSLNVFTNLGAIVIGINKGSVASHKKMQNDFRLHYQLLSDSAMKVLAAFGVNENTFSKRYTYIIDKTGMVVFKYFSLTGGKKHPHEALDYIRELNDKNNTLTFLVSQKKTNHS